MNKKYLFSIISSAILAGSFTTSIANAEGKLTMYCSAGGVWCQKVAESFAKKFDVKVSMTRSSTGSTYAKILAEKENPRGDVWFGGTLDPHSQAGENGLLETYKSANLKLIGKQYQNPASNKANQTTGIYVGILGFSVNTDMLKVAKLEMPKCWSDLTKPQYKGQIQMASPQSSGTAYTALATFAQLFGEDKSFEYLAKLHKNINQYTKSGSAPSKNTARGENMIGVSFLHSASREKSKGFPIELVTPCEGTGYEIGGLSIIKNARNMDNAKKFVDWSLTKEAQEIAATAESYQAPTNTSAKIPAEAIKPESVTLIDYDFVKYGSEKQRKQLIERWIKDIKPVAR